MQHEHGTTQGHPADVRNRPRRQRPRLARGRRRQQRHERHVARGIIHRNLLGRPRVLSVRTSATPVAHDLLRGGVAA